MKEKGEMGRDICLAKDFATHIYPLSFLLSKYLFASKQITKAEQHRNGFRKGRYIYGLQPQILPVQ